MNSLVSLWRHLAIEIGDLCGIKVIKDIETLSFRCQREGDAFLHITLPAFGKSFDQALEHGQISSDHFAGFQRRGGLPLFLGGFLRNIFAPDGAMVDVPCVESIRAVRQLTAVFGKVESLSSERRNRKAVRGYIDADEACLDWDLTIPENVIDELSHCANRVLGPLLSEAEWLVGKDRIVPRHGPGQTADRLMGNQKFDQRYWPQHLESRFPWSEWGVPNYRYADPAAWCTHSSKDVCNVADSSTHTVPARLTLVPKTASTPRVIVMEPNSLQYMQQGLLRIATEHLERGTTQVGFTDQGLNRSMARSGSIHKDTATLDLSEASDRVTYLQAASVFSAFPKIWEALDATRSSEVRLLDGEIREIHKFASMGSAVCFPVEACVFYAAIYMAIRRHYRKTDPWFDLTWSFVKQNEGQIRVYGDDIIVPVEYLPSVYEVFQLLGWKINTNKSFSLGNFRESCGGDFWCGHDVTPIRVRRAIPTNRRQIDELQSFVSTRNQLYLAGYWRTAAVADIIIEDILRGCFPITGSSLPDDRDQTAGLTRVSVSFKGLALRTNSYHRAMTRAWVVKSIIPKNESTGTGKLLKYFIMPGLDDEQLYRSGRPSAVSIKRKWVTIPYVELVAPQGPIAS